MDKLGQRYDVLLTERNSRPATALRMPQRLLVEPC